ncbi:diacylglycerol kinase theta [Eurytemora carolleeae]|uniref:diacylglycerol kinase theta n=1 Tax=Eurytemora carolleeae TaxID=1294199 RepID=UPI000C77557B|nr:diacylglycerol kinase theta [Eurytemora carolleeae]|eukprot:XP_023323725.1 diacylglycerol kinase theta-like [Eurytemora affinis]
MATDQEICMGGEHGHSFVKKTFTRPTNCHQCTEYVWGLVSQGFFCEVCNFLVHEKCIKTIGTPCVGLAASLVKNPVAHFWSEEKSIKGKFCNVCRKKIHEAPGLHCEVCDYYIHDYCQEFAVQEGNLPPNSKCVKCRKACWSPDCLTGMRCCWCGMTVHSSCLNLVSEEMLTCCFGKLEPIFLPPHAVSIPRTQMSQVNFLGLKPKESVGIHHLYRTAEGKGLAVSDDWSSTVCGESVVQGGAEASRELEESMPSAVRSREREKKEKQVKEKEKELEEELIKVFDGYTSLRKRLFRTITVSKFATKDQLLAAAMKAFVVSQDSRIFYLLDVYADCDNAREEEIQDPYPVHRLVRRENRRPAILIGLRDIENDVGIIKVWPQKLQVSQCYISVSVTSSVTAGQVISYLIHKNISHQNVRLFIFNDKIVIPKINMHTLSDEEIPWELLKRRGFESVRLMELTRFYLQLREDPHGPNVALFIGNLPPNLSHKNYETIFYMDTLNNVLYCLDERALSLGPIYYEYGSMVITFNSSNSAVDAYETLKNRVYEDKNLLVIMLPTIDPSMIPVKTVPLLVFVNVKSGGCQGLQLISSFRKLLNPYQVFDLSVGGPLPGWVNIDEGCEPLQGWVLQCLDNVGQDSQCSNPPCAIVPLGTGNDLARVLRWGPGYGGDEDPQSLLRDVIEAEEIRLDRWTVVFRPLSDESGTPGADGKPLISSAQTNEDNAQIFVMNNYFGLGLDADLCLDFHNAREEKPEKFNSRLHNKGVYVKVSLRKMVGRKMCKDLHKVLKLEVDGNNVELPPIEGIIILNIMSWGSGANPWGLEKDDKFSKPNHWDGMLEVVGVTGMVHLGQIQSGLRSAIRIAQGSHLKIHMNREVPVQVDGEPWIQPAGDIVVLKSALKATMLKKQKHKVKRRNTAPPTNLPITPVRSSSTPPVPSSAPPHQSPPLNLADLCDSPSHATAV